MNRKIGILLLCGLPGAGKSTFAANIQTYVMTNASLPVNNEYKQTAVKDTWASCKELTTQENIICPCKITCIHICYDDIMPTNLQFGDEDGEKNISIWKRHRKQIRSCVEQCIEDTYEDGVPSETCEDGVPSETCEDGVPSEIWTKFKSMKMVERELHQVGDHLYLYIIDDNMFFSSMRYEYYQLARRYQTGFGQIYLKCSREEAETRNRGRPSPVDPSTIVAMATKFEPPDPNNHWEKMSLTLESEGCSLEENLERSWEFILNALNHPVQCVEVDEVKRSTDRVVCSQSVIHQADLIIRKLIGQRMQNEQVKLDKNKMKQKASELNQRKLDILHKMKSGELLVDQTLEQFVTDSSKDYNNPLYQHVKDIFES